MMVIASTTQWTAMTARFLATASKSPLAFSTLGLRLTWVASHGTSEAGPEEILYRFCQSVYKMYK